MGRHSKHEPRAPIQGPWLFAVVALVVFVLALGIGSYLLSNFLWPSTPPSVPTITAVAPTEEPDLPVPPSTKSTKVRRMGTPDYSKVNAK